MKTRDWIFTVAMISFVAIGLAACGGGTSSKSSNSIPIVNAGTAPSGNEGESLAFSGSFNDPDSGDTHTYEWNFGDGTADATTLTPSHTYADNGIFNVTLTVEDNNGGIGTDTLSVTVLNVAPTVDAGGDQSVSENDLVSFAGSVTDPGTADTLDYLWDFGDFSPISTNETPSHVYTNQGVFTVVLTVTDDDGASNADSLKVTVNNEPPIVDAGEDQIVNEGVAVAFHGSAYDPGGDTLSYGWNFGDGSTTSGSLTPSHAYTNQGIYVVNLTVSDDIGSVMDSLTVTVNAVTPEAPTGLTITLITSNSIAMAWSDNATYEDGFYVMRSDNFGGPFSTIATLGKNSENYTDTTVSPGSTYYYRVASYNTAGVSSFSATVSATAAALGLGNVGPYYSNNGADWNDYVDNDGTTIFNASDNAAARTGSGGYLSVIHGGEMRSVSVSGITSCVDISAYDNLGVFDWTCLPGTPVTVVSTGLADGINLHDLVDFTTPSWLGNYVTVLNGAIEYGVTSETIWWSNPVYAVGATSILSTEAAIYAVASSTTMDLVIDADKVALVTDPYAGVKIRGNSEGSNVLLSNSNSFLWIEADLMGASVGSGSGSILDLTDVEFSILRGVSASGSGTGSGVALINSRNNLMTDITAVSNDDFGVVLNGSDENRLYSVKVANNGFIGLEIDTADANIISDIVSYNNQDRGVRLHGSTDNVLLGLTTASNGYGCQLWGVDNNVLANITATNNRESGLAVQASSLNTIDNMAGINDVNGVYVYEGAEYNLLNNLALGHNDFGVLMNNSSYNTYTGLLEVGNNSAMDCSVTGGTDPGLDSITCGNSGATLTTGVYFAASFEAKVMSDDSQNISDDNGSALYFSIVDWINFENDFRSWGRDGDTFPDRYSRGPTNTSVGMRIWDWSLDGLDTVLLDALAIPGASDTLTHSWSDASTTEFLKNAVEIVNDHVGNDNGLCEVGEDCIFTPNIGNYQGHGSLILIDPPPAAGYVLYEFQNNGR